MQFAPGCTYCRLTTLDHAQKWVHCKKCAVQVYCSPQCRAFDIPAHTDYCRVDPPARRAKRSVDAMVYAMHNDQFMASIILQDPRRGVGCIPLVVIPTVQTAHAFFALSERNKADYLGDLMVVEAAIAETDCGPDKEYSRAKPRLAEMCAIVAKPTTPVAKEEKAAEDEVLSMAAIIEAMNFEDDPREFDARLAACIEILTTIEDNNCIRVSFETVADLDSASATAGCADHSAEDLQTLPFMCFRATRVGLKGECINMQTVTVSLDAIFGEVDEREEVEPVAK